MVNHSTGSFGYYNPVANPFTNVGGMYMLGQGSLNSTMTPGVSNMFGSVAQQYFNPYSIEPVGYGYQSPQMATHSYGFTDYLKHDILGVPRPIGVNPLNVRMAQREYKSLAQATIGFDAAGIVGGAAVGAGLAALGAPLALTIGAPLAIAAAADYGAELYRGNYKRTQHVGALFSNMVRSDGSVGLTGSEASSITKKLDKLASKDLLINADELTTIAQEFKNVGMLANVGSASEITGKIKQLKDTLKVFADVINSTDMKETIAQIGKMRQMGFSTTSMVGAAAAITTSGRFAGMSQQAAMDNFNANVMALQQTGLMSPAMNNTKMLASAERELYVHSHKVSESINGVTDDKLVYYAGYKAKEEGRSIQEVIDEMKGLSIEEKTRRVYGYAQGRPDYAKGLTDKNYRSAIIHTFGDISNLEIEDNFEMNFNRYKEMLKNSGDKLTTKNFMRIWDTEHLSDRAIEVLRAKVEMSIKYGPDYAKKVREVGKRMEKRSIVASQTSDVEEEESAYGQLKLGLKGIRQNLREFFGGYDAAGKIQDEARDVYGNYAVGDMGGKRGILHYEGYKMTQQKKLKVAASLVSSLTSFGRAAYTDEDGGMQIDFDAMSKDDFYKKEPWNNYDKKIKSLSGSLGVDLSSDRKIRSLDQIKGKTTDKSPFSMLSMDFWVDAATMNPLTHSAKYRSKQEGFWDTAADALEDVVSGVTWAVTNFNPIGIAYNAVTGRNPFWSESDDDYYKSSVSNRAIYKSKVNYDVASDAMRGMKGKDRLTTLKLADETGSIFKDKTYGARLKMAALYESGASDKEVKEILRQEKEAGVFSDEETFTIGEYREFKEKIKDTGALKKIKKSVAGMSDKDISKEMARIQENKGKEVLLALSKAGRELGEGATAEELRAKVLSDNPEMGDMLMASRETLMDVYTSMNDGVQKRALGKMINSSMVSTKELKEAKDKEGKRIYSDEKIQASEGIFKTLSSSNMSIEDTDRIQGELVSAIAKGDKDKINELMSQASKKMSAKNFTKLSQDVNMIANVEDEEQRKKLLSHGIGKSMETGKRIVESVSRVTGLSEKDAAKLIGIVSESDPTKRSKEFLEFRNKSGSEKLKDMSLDEVMSSISKSSVFEKLDSGQKMIENNASARDVTAKLYDLEKEHLPEIRKNLEELNEKAN